MYHCIISRNSLLSISFLHSTELDEKKISNRVYVIENRKRTKKEIRKRKFNIIHVKRIANVSPFSPLTVFFLHITFYCIL